MKTIVRAIINRRGLYNPAGARKADARELKEAQEYERLEKNLATLTPKERQRYSSLQAKGNSYRQYSLPSLEDAEPRDAGETQQQGSASRLELSAEDKATLKQLRQKSKQEDLSAEEQETLKALSKQESDLKLKNMGLDNQAIPAAPQQAQEPQSAKNDRLLKSYKVEITRPDGKTTHAYHLPAQDGQETLVVFHAKDITAKQQFLKLAEEARSQGKGLICVEHRAYAHKGSTPSEKSFQQDIDGTINYLKENKITNTVAVGSSLGAASALEFAYTCSENGRKADAGVTCGGVVVDSPFTNAKEAVAGFLENNKKYAPSRWLRNRVVNSMKETQWDNESKVAFIEAPIVVLSPESKDTIVPKEQHQKVYDAARTSREGDETKGSVQKNEYPGGHASADTGIIFGYVGEIREERERVQVLRDDDGEAVPVHAAKRGIAASPEDIKRFLETQNPFYAGAYNDMVRDVGTEAANQWVTNLRGFEASLQQVPAETASLEEPSQAQLSVRTETVGEDEKGAAGTLPGFQQPQQNDAVQAQKEEVKEKGKERNSDDLINRQPEPRFSTRGTQVPSRPAPKAPVDQATVVQPQGGASDAAKRPTWEEKGKEKVKERPPLPTGPKPVLKPRPTAGAGTTKATTQVEEKSYEDTLRGYLKEAFSASETVNLTQALDVFYKDHGARLFGSQGVAEEIHTLQVKQIAPVTMLANTKGSVEDKVNAALGLFVPVAASMPNSINQVGRLYKGSDVEAKRVYDNFWSKFSPVFGGTYEGEGLRISPKEPSASNQQFTETIKAIDPLLLAYPKEVEGIYKEYQEKGGVTIADKQGFVDALVGFAREKHEEISLYYNSPCGQTQFEQEGTIKEGALKIQAGNVAGSEALEEKTGDPSFVEEIARGFEGLKPEPEIKPSAQSKPIDHDVDLKKSKSESALKNHPGVLEAAKKLGSKIKAETWSKAKGKLHHTHEEGQAEAQEEKGGKKNQRKLGNKGIREAVDKGVIPKEAVRGKEFDTELSDKVKAQQTTPSNGKQKGTGLDHG